MQQATWSNLYNKFGHVAHMFMPVRLEIDMRGMQKGCNLLLWPTAQPQKKSRPEMETLDIIWPSKNWAASNIGKSAMILT